MQTFRKIPLQKHIQSQNITIRGSDIYANESPSWFVITEITIILGVGGKKK